MSGMQEEFICGVRELLTATRPHVNYVKDFERRAEQNPKACAEEAFGEVISSGRILYRIFEKTFQEDPAKAAERVFRRSPEGLEVLREDAALPDNPVVQEFFLLWLYWLSFYAKTLRFFKRCINTPSGPNTDHARAICACFVKHELVSYAAYLIVADDVVKRFPHQKVQQALVEQFTAFFIAYTSLHTNKRLRKVIDEFREPDESRFERLIKEVSGEVLSVWCEQRAA